jgi:hypothetical protein
LEASKADEDKIFPGYIDVIALTSMVAEHLESLPPPPPLQPHAQPVANYEGQEVMPHPVFRADIVTTRMEWSSTRQRSLSQRSSSTSSPTTTSS